jgi:opacity protein-like surface antigen
MNTRRKKAMISTTVNLWRIPIQRMAAAAVVLALWASPAYPRDNDKPLYCQAIVSLMELDQESPDMADDSHNLTFFGAAAQKPFHGDSFEFGFETGANFSMKNDTDVLYASVESSGTKARVAIDNEWFLFDYFGGGYVAANIARRLRLYAGAGPLLIYGSWSHEPEEDDSEFEDETESHLSGGLYARAGLEVFIFERVSLGGGVRAIATGLDFDDEAGEADVEGPQLFFNFTFKI